MLSMERSLYEQLQEAPKHLLIGDGSSCTREGGHVTHPSVGSFNGRAGVFDTMDFGIGTREVAPDLAIDGRDSEASQAAPTTSNGSYHGDVMNVIIQVDADSSDMLALGEGQGTWA